MSKQTTWTLVLLATMFGLGVTACEQEAGQGAGERPTATTPGQPSSPPPGSTNPSGQPGSPPGGGAGESGTNR